MFSWNAPKTYYQELMTPRLERSLDDRLDSTLFRTDAPGVVCPRYMCHTSGQNCCSACGRLSAEVWAESLAWGPPAWQ